ncbi:MAG: YgjP-like metallopeptidase domain-containing protein, partial [Pseudomonadota bacterium]|nr:YgjP-like metallopeptidase domain-containing protein [Pseudomonadota bacterium]
EKIWLSFQLVHFPLELLEYVVVHELTHLFERYHNRRFYALMDSFLPNWRSLKQRLNHYEIPDYPSGQ